MATKKLETEFNNLKKDFIGLPNLIKNLLDKHENLQKKYDKFIQKQQKKNFKCRKCGDTFEKLKNLQDHKEKGCSNDKYKCDECEKYFDDENKLQKHTEKKHLKFECDDCDKVFKYEAVLEKHREAAHDDVQLFCHYYNNDKDCPYVDQCIYVHEESENCKFGSNFAQNLCMYQHEKSVDEESDNDGESSDDDDVAVVNDDIDFEEIKPALEKFKQADDNFEQLLGKHNLKCKQCEFEAKDMNGLNMHMKAKHKI